MRSVDVGVTISDAIVDRVGKTIVLALPLGLGKANHIAKALYDKAAADPSLKLTIFTALTLEAPRAKNEMEHRFLDPIEMGERCGQSEIRIRVVSVGLDGRWKTSKPLMEKEFTENTNIRR